MSTVVAIVKSIVGQVIATSAEGAHRVLVEGDRLYVGDTLDTGAGGMVTLELADGRMLDLGRDTQWSSADAASPITEATAQSAAEARAEVVDVQRAIVAGADPTQDLPATAAGPGAGGAAGGAAGGGRSFVLLSETAGEVQPEIGINFSNTTDGDGVVQQQAFGTEQNVAPRFVTADGNDASPTINVTTDEDVAFNGAFTAVDNNGDALTYTLVGTGPANGSLTLSPQGVWVYTPVANYNGPDSFQVVVTDGRGASDTLTVNIGVTPVNDAPVADAANGSATEDGAIISGQLTASDVDTGDTQTFTLQAGATAPAGFTLNGNGTWSIDPSNAAYQNLAAGEQLTLNVPFTVTDSGGLTSNNVLTLTITGVNDAPVVSGNVTITTNEDAGGLTVDLLANASDVDKGDVVSVTSVAQSGAGDASGVTINANGTLSVTPGAYNYLAAGESVTLTYTYNVVDQNGGVTPASATITIDGVNDAPVVSAAVSAATNEDAAPLTVNLLQNASDVDLSDSLSVANLQETSGGNTAGVSLNADGTLSVNPNAYTYLAAGQQVVLNYTYDVIDSNGGVTPATATITIDGRNDAPVAVADVKSGSEDTVITGNVISNDSDVDAGAVLSVTKFSYSVGPFTFSANAGETLNTIVGKLTISANGDFTFTPVANYNGPVPTVTYTLSDGTATSTATLNINVTPVNDAPFITAPSSVQVTSEDTSKVFSVLRGNSIATGDIDSANLTTTLNVDHGTLTLGPLAGGVTVTGNGTGSLVLSGSSAAINAALQGLNYKPTADYNGVDNLKISSTDGSLTTNSNVAIRVDAVADIRPDTVSVNEDNVLTFNAITGVGGGTADNFENAGRAVTSVTQGAHGSVTFNADGTLVYTPAANYNGTDTFTYTVTSGGVTETATVTVNVNPVNDAAVLTPANVAVAETDAAITTGGTLSISDIDSPATFAAQTSTAGTYGTFSVDANGAWTYQANAAYNNLNVGQSVSDTFTVVSADGTPTTVTVTINGTNDAPVASSTVVASGNEDSAAPIAVTLAGSDVDGTVTSYSIESLPNHGTLYSDAAGTQAISVGQVVSGPVYFVPTANWGGSTTFDFKAIDNNGASSTTGSAAINVTPVADAPTLTFGAGSQLASTDFQEINLSGGFSNSVSEGSLGGGQWHTDNSGNAVEVGSEGTYINGGSGSNQVIELERNPGDASNLYTTVAAQAGDTFVVQLQYSPRSGSEANSSIDVFWAGVKVGTLSGTTAGLTNYSFTLPADTAGNYTLEFRATDSNSVGGLLDNISLGQQVNVGLEDHAIRLSSITAAVTDTDGSESISKITIDDAPAGSVLSDGNGNTVTSTGSPVDITGWAKGSLTLTPPANFNGTIVLHVSATSSEATGGSATTTLPLTVTVRPENDAPTATNQSLTTEEDTPLTGTVTGSDVDGDTLTYSLVTAPAHGTLTLNTNGSFTYTPAKDYTGPDSFQALVSDGKGGTTTSIISIGVTPDNDAPIVGNQTLTTAEDTPLTGAVTGSDADGDSLSYTVKTPAANGNVALNADGTFTYTPNSNYNGSDTFTVTVADGKGGTVDSVISIGVTPVNDAPTSANQSLTTAEDTPLTGAVTGTDVDGDSLSYTVKTPAANGNVALNADGTFTYTPNSNYNGGDSFTVTVADGKGGTVDSVISIGVTPVNDAPTSANQSLTTSEDTPLTGAVTGTDVDGDTLSYNVKTPAANGNVALNADGTFTYTPNANYNGGDSFTVTIADGKGGTVDSVISIGVTPVNDAPTSVNQSLTTAEDTPLTGAVTGADADGDSLSYTVKTPAANGNVALNADGTFTYTPNSNYNGGDSFTVTVSDGKGGTVDSVISIGVTPVNDAPTAANQTLTTAEDTPLTGAVTGTDVDGDSLSYNVKTPAANGTVTLNADGTFTYTPNSNYNGSDTFTVAVSDGKGGTVDSVISVGVTPVNDAPTSANQSLTTAEDTPLTGAVTGTDVDGDTLSYNVKTPAANGNVALNADGTFTYTPNANYNGGDSFTVTIADGKGGTVDSVISIGVTPVNDAPTSVNQSLTTAEDTPLTGAVTGTDVDGDSLSYTVKTPAANGNVALNADGTFTYTPNSNYNGSDTFTVAVSDGKGGTVDSVISVGVTPVNDAPTSANQSLTTAEDTPLTGDVTGTDVDGDSLSYNVKTPAANGTVTLNADGTFTYTPNSNYNGSDSFTVTVSDGKGGTVDSVISIGVTPVNDAPTSANQTLTTAEDTPLNGAVTGTDVDGDSLSYTVKTPAANGNVALNADGTFTYTPNGNYNGSDTFTVTVADGKGGTVDSVISIGVTPVNDAPTSANQSLTTAEDTPLTGAVTGTDVDGDTLSYTVKTPAANGNVALNADGTFTYTPNSNYNGSDTFTVTVADGKGGTVDSVISIGVTPVNDAPTTANQSLTTAEDTPLTGAVTGSDADGDTLSYALKTGPANGTVLVGSDGKFTYSPASNYNGADTFTVTVSDGKGGTVDSVINIGVTPVNDAPVVTSSPAAATGTAVEAGNTDAGATVTGTPSVTGTLTASDVDQGSVTTWTVANGAGNYGTLAITAAGVWTYTLDNAKAATQALAEGQTGKETFTATVSDGQGGTATQVITVDVTGTNDSPVVAAALTAAGVEDGAPIVVNLLSGASDVDAGAVLKVSGVSALPAGVSLSGSTLTVNPSNASFQSLAQAETKVITVTYNVEDDKGAVTPQTATITVTGTNDAPTVSGAVTASGAEDSASFNVNLLTNASDVDNGAVLSVTDVGTLPAGVTRSGTTLSVNPSDSSFQSLAVGESKVLTINYSVTDQFGAKTAQTAVITITGTNDAPVVTSSAAAATGTVVEAGNTDPGAVVAGTPSATGTLTASDADHNSSTTWSLPNGGAGSFGTLALTAAGVWTYSLDNAKAATQALAEGQAGKETFTALVSDGQGGTATQVITVNVTGTNDSPVVSGAVTASGVEDGASFTVNLLAGASDVDSGSSLSVANVGTLPAGVSRVGSVLTVDPSNAAFQALKAGEQQTLTVTYKVVDDKGAVVAQTAVITVTGTNDAPVITSNAAAAAGTVTEAGLTPAGAATAGTATASGTLTATDVDHDSSTSWSLASGTGTGTYGSLTLSAAGAWTYTLDNSKPATQALAVGESRTETFNATVSDGQGGSKVQVITVTVNGTNDAPVVTSAASAATGTVVEAGLTPAGAATAGTPSATGTLTASDADHGSSTTWSVANGTGTYGSLTMSSAGVWTYTLDNSKPATQALGAGSTGTETFTATVSDGLGGTTTQVINVNVTGTNDAPVAVADTYVLGLTGQYYGYAQGNGANLATISQVESLIAGKTPDATFVSTNLNYGGVSTNLGEGTNLQTFLGNDKASLSTDPGNTSDAIIKLSGQISLAAGNYTFKVTSDDGFILRIDGQDVVKFDGNRSAASTTANFTIPTGGAHQIEIVYWDQGGNAALKVEVKAAGAADTAYTVLGASGNTGSLVTAEDTALTINASTLLKNDSDVDGNALTLTSVQNATHGTVALNNGVITFTPEANYNGEATFQYSVSDGKGGTASATVTMYVTPVNDAPVVAVTPVALSGDEDTSITITSAQLLGNATDPDGNALTVVGLSKTSGEGTLVANADGTWTFTPTKDWNGEVKFSYTVSDGTVATADSAVLTVKPVADIKADTGVTDEDTAITLNVLGNDGFSNTATISAINGTSIASNGSVTVDHGSVKLVNGQLLFTPTADYHGQSNFTYTVTSGGVTETSTVSLMVNSVSDAAIPTVSVTPKGYWTFDSTTSSGSVVTNEITKQTGTLADADSNKTVDLPQLSSTSRAEGAGKNLVFNSGSDTGDHIDVSTSVTAALMGTATLTFWINTAQAGNANGAGSAWSNPSIIGSEQVSGGNDIQWGAINAAGKIGFGLGNVDGVYSTTSVNDSQWHNVAISRDSSTGLVNVYVDGKLEATGSPVDAAFTGALNQLLEIGATNAFTGNGKDANDTSYFKGALDDLRIYSGVLSADQVAAIHHVENGYQGTAIANATTTNESTLSLSVTDNASVLKVSGLEAGMIISDGNGHTATSTGVDSLIDLSNWTTSNLTLSHTGTDSGTLIFTGTNTAANGDVSTTYQALTLANGTSVLATGTAGADTLTGSTAADLLRGGDGNDTLHGLAGNDRLEGGNGNDSLFGGAGNDLLIGGAGDDILYGGSGNNILTGGANADTFTWQAGDVGKSTITDFNASEGDRINLSDLLPDITDTNVLSYLKVDTATSTIQVSTSGHIDQGSDVSITLQGVDLNNYGSSSADIIKSLVAGTDPVVKTDHH